MKSSLLALLVLALSAAADKHRLCCCATQNCDGSFSCDETYTRKVVTGSWIAAKKQNEYILSNQAWKSADGAPVDGEANSWYYSSAQVDDAWVGGVESYWKCKGIKSDSYCFSPKKKNYWNENREGMNKRGGISDTPRNRKVYDGQCDAPAAANAGAKAGAKVA